MTLSLCKTIKFTLNVHQKFPVEIILGSEIYINTVLTTLYKLQSKKLLKNELFDLHTNNTSYTYNIVS